MNQYHLFASNIASGHLTIENLQEEGAIQRSSISDIHRLLDEARDKSVRQPDLGQGLAAVAWVAAHSHKDPRLQAHATLVYGRTLVRAELPSEALEILRTAFNAWSQLENNQSQLAICNWQMGTALRIQNRYPEAIEKLVDAIHQLDETENELDAARCRVELARTYNSQGRSDLVKETLDCAFRIFQRTGDAVETARCRVTDASRLQSLGRFKEALEQLDDALPTLEEANLPVEQAMAHYVYAFLHMQRGTFAPAITNTQQAQRFFKLVNLLHWCARCNNLLGAISLRDLRPREAISDFEIAADWFSRNNVNVEYAQCQLNLGIAHHLLGHFQLARQKIEIAIPILQHAGEEFSTSMCWMRLGAILREEGRLQDSLSQLERAWEAWAKIDRPHYAAKCALHLALVHRQLGQRVRTDRWLQEALELYWSTDSIIGVVRTHLEISRTRIDSQDYSGALQSALAAHNDARISIGDQALCQRRLGEISAAKHDWNAAVFHFEESVNLFSDLGMVLNALESRIELGRALGHLEPDEAQTVLEAAYEDASAWHFPNLAWRTAVSLAELAKENDDNSEELSFLNAAIDWLIKHRRRLTQSALDKAFLADKAPYLSRGMSLALELGQPELALVFNDETRPHYHANSMGRSLEEILPENERVKHLFGRRMELLADLRLLEDNMRRSSIDIQSWLPNAYQANLMGRYHNTAKEYEKVCEQLERIAQTVNNLSMDTAPLDLQKLQEIGMFCLAYHWHGNAVTIFIITPNSIQAVHKSLSPIDQKALENCTSLDDQRRALAYDSPYSNVQNSNLSKYWRRRLYDILVPSQATAAFSPENTLVIIPHGPLYNLAFQALIDPSGSFLIEKTAICYAPSFSLLQTLAGKEADSSHSSRGALVIGVSEFQKRYPDIPNATNEATRIASGASLPCKLLLDEQATVDNVKAHAGHYQFIHLVTHGIFNTDYGRLGGFALHDADLLLDDLSSIELTAPLVTLSTCNSGQGIGQLDNQIGGVAGCFFSLGAKTIVASQWPVHDVASGVISTFYQALKITSSTAVALATAQRAYLDLPPYQWASFSCFGIP